MSVTTVHLHPLSVQSDTMEKFDALEAEIRGIQEQLKVGRAPRAGKRHACMHAHEYIQCLDACRRIHAGEYMQFLVSSIHCVAHPPNACFGNPGLS